MTASLDGDVLTVLAGGDVALTGREIARRVGASQDGARVALNRLVRQGIVRRDRLGAAYLYRLNRNHLAAKWIEGLASLRLELLRQLRTRIGGWRIPADVVRLFGSAARGDAGGQSDLDLLVVRPPGVSPEDQKWRAQLRRLETFATAATGNDARVLEYGAAEYLRLRGREPVLRTAISEGIDLGRASVPKRSQPKRHSK